MVRGATLASLGRKEHPYDVRRPEADPLLRALQMSFLSNNWAVDGRWTGTGKSAFAMDPHMPTSLPPFPYIIGLVLNSAGRSGFFTSSGPASRAYRRCPSGQTAWWRGDRPRTGRIQLTCSWKSPSAGRDGYYATEKGDAPFTIRHRDIPRQAREDSYRNRDAPRAHQPPRGDRQ